MKPRRTSKPQPSKSRPRAAAAPQLRIKKILVPVDFSDPGKPSLRYARFLARQTGAGLCLLHVLEPVYYHPDFSHVQPGISELREHANRELGALQAGQFRDVKTTSDIREGQPFQEIVDAARDTGADLIVMATHGHTGLQHILLGSTAERVVRHAACPVLVVRSKLPAKPARKPAAGRGHPRRIKNP